jgi:proteasome accessory factor C
VSRPSAGDRLRRLLALLPYIAEHPGTTIDELCSRFGLTRAQLLSDLDVVWMVGLPPYTPDQLLEVDIDDDRVSVHLGDSFRRPLRLTSDQALALVAAGQSLISVPGTDPEGPLARGLAKLADALQVDPDTTVEVHLGEATSSTLDELRRALDEGRRVRLDYYGYGRDERTERDVDPHRLWSEAGSWYLGGYCHRAEGPRVFRVDRIHGVEVLDQPATTGPTEETATFTPGPGDARITLELAPEAGWVVEHYPNEAAEELGDGRWRVVLAVSSLRWLEQLLVRLGPRATVVDRSGDIPADVAGAAARRVLARYQR